MRHIEYTKGDAVILIVGKTAEVAVISKSYTYKSVSVYDVVTERGSYFTRITTDPEKHLVYIDVAATNKFRNRINPTVSESLINEKVISYEIISGDTGIPGFDDDSFGGTEI